MFRFMIFSCWAYLDFGIVGSFHEKGVPTMDPNIIICSIEIAERAPLISGTPPCQELGLLPGLGQGLGLSLPHVCTSANQ